MYFLYRVLVVSCLIGLCLTGSGCRPESEDYILTPSAASVEEEREAAKDTEITASGDMAARLSTDSAAQEEAHETSKKTNEKTVGVIVVHICGAVNKPGVYELPEGSRVIDAVTKGGGLSEEADERGLNEARILSDGEQIIVPIVGEVAITGDRGAALDGIDSKININTAGLDGLQTLTGIGETKARAILDDRDRNGPFSKTEDIMRVTGIGEGVFNRIRDDITV